MADHAAKNMNPSAFLRVQPHNTFVRLPAVTAFGVPDLPRIPGEKTDRLKALI